MLSTECPLFDWLAQQYDSIRKIALDKIGVVKFVCGLDTIFGGSAPYEKKCDVASGVADDAQGLWPQITEQMRHRICELDRGRRVTCNPLIGGRCRRK